MDRKLGLEFSNPPLRSRTLGELRSRDAGLEAGVDSRLTAPAVDRLLAHFEFYRDVSNLSAAFNQIYDSSPKLRRVTPSCHLVLLSG